LAVACEGEISLANYKANRQSANSETPQLTIQQRLRYGKQFLYKILQILNFFYFTPAVGKNLSTLALLL
jgi:hypothetical protein